jgi:hypothetical protein
VVYQFLGVEGVIAQFLDPKQLRGLFDIRLDKIIVNHVPGGGRDKPLVHPGSVGHFIVVLFFGDKILRDVKPVDVFKGFTLRFWVEGQDKCADILGGGEIQPAVAAPPGEFRFVVANVPALLPGLRGDPA